MLRHSHSQQRWFFLCLELHRKLQFLCKWNVFYLPSRVLFDWIILSNQYLQYRLPSLRFNWRLSYLQKFPFLIQLHHQKLCIYVHSSKLCPMQVRFYFLPIMRNRILSLWVDWAMQTEPHCQLSFCVWFQRKLVHLRTLLEGICSDIRSEPLSFSKLQFIYVLSNMQFFCLPYLRNWIFS